MSKEKFDLSNVGGQPKDWAQKSKEAEIDSYSTPSRRYFATISSSSSSSEVLLGTFTCLEDAQRRAEQRFLWSGQTVVSIRAETNFQSALHKLTRIAIRALRITIGVLIALASYMFLSDGALDFAKVPFAAMTLSLLIGSLSKIAIMCGLYWLAWVIAFGEAPKANLN